MLFWTLQYWYFSETEISWGQVSSQFISVSLLHDSCIPLPVVTVIKECAVEEFSIKDWLPGREIYKSLGKFLAPSPGPGHLQSVYKSSMGQDESVGCFLFPPDRLVSFYKILGVMDSYPRKAIRRSGYPPTRKWSCSCRIILKWIQVSSLLPGRQIGANGPWVV